MSGIEWPVLGWQVGQDALVRNRVVGIGIGKVGRRSFGRIRQTPHQADRGCCIDPGDVAVLTVCRSGFVFFRRGSPTQLPTSPTPRTQPTNELGIGPNGHDHPHKTTIFPIENFPFQPNAPTTTETTATNQQARYRTERTRPTKQNYYLPYRKPRRKKTNPDRLTGKQHRQDQLLQQPRSA